MRDDVLKYKSSITSMESVATLQHQVKLTNLEDACKMVIQACKSDDFPFLRAASGNLPFLSMYRCINYLCKKKDNQAREMMCKNK